MEKLFFIAALAFIPRIATAQEVKGPQVTSLFVEVFPVNNSPAGAVATVDYGIKALEIGRLKITASGFLDLEPAGARKFYFNNNGQVVKYGAVPIGIMFEEGAGRNPDPAKPASRYVRVGATANLNDLPGIRRLSRPVFAAMNVSWLGAAHGNIQDEIKLSVATRGVPIGIGWVNAGGFYRIRYGSKRNFGQPQVVFRPRKPDWLKLVLEVEQNGHQVDLYFGARMTLVKK